VVQLDLVYGLAQSFNLVALAGTRLSRPRYARAAIESELPLADFRPSVERLSHVDDEPPVLAVSGPPALNPKAFERARQETE